MNSSISHAECMEETPFRLLSLALPSSKDIMDYVVMQNGLFSLSDSKTCDSPRRTERCPENCDRQILFIQSQNDVAIVRFDEWQELSEDEKCDYLLFDVSPERKRLSFCELTCSLEKYVVPDSVAAKPGKRAKAYNQISKAWDIIKNSHNPVFSNFALQYREKTGIFGWRDRERNSSSKAGMNAMRSFTRTPGSDSGITRFKEYTIDGVYTFIQVKYPSVFDW